MDRFVFVGGKGGVGKTTIASAYAQNCATAGLRTLVVSTDPAHSTADVFGQELGDEPQSVVGIENLWAMEIDPDAEIETHLQEIKRAMTDQVSPAIVNQIDRQIELAHRTPGAYEAALFDRLIDVMRDTDAFDRVVFDTAPTGNTLRLLSLPDVLGDWVDRLAAKRKQSVDLFERTAIGDTEATQTVEDDPIIARLTERKELFEFAADTLRTEASFYIVLNPDDLSITETERAIATLAEQHLPVEGLVINKVAPEPDPDETGRGATYLRNRYERERERIESIQTTFDVPVVATIEQRPQEVKADRLAAVAAELDIDPGR